MRAWWLALLLLCLQPAWAAPDAIPTINPIPDQLLYQAFTITVSVADSSGHPVPGATVHVTVDPAFIKARYGQVVLRDTGRNPVSEVTAVTAADGSATVWLRLNSTDKDQYPADFKVRLLAQVDPAHVASSNVFSVFSEYYWQER